MSTYRLRLANGQDAWIVGPAGDQSVLGAIIHTNGVWEPHLQALFARMIQPDWVCLDLGANIGAHTLSMGALGARVIAFEAATENYAFLEQNVRAAGLSPKAHLVNRAVWRETGPLHLYWTEGLAGCAFVMEQHGDAQGEDQLRAVVSNPALQADAFQGTSRPIDAVRLDDWAREIGLQRLDFIKMDVEGAEIQALEGALETFATHAPWLVTEYNPSCAAAYFGAGARDYFDALARVSDDIRIVLPDGDLSPSLDWLALERYIAVAGWADLLCAPPGRTSPPKA